MHRITIEYGAPADPDAFEQRYAEVHVPLVRTLPGLSRFTLTHPRAIGGSAPYLVAELWFDDLDALKAALRSPEMAGTAEDADVFDVASMDTFSGEVREIAL